MRDQSDIAAVAIVIRSMRQVSGSLFAVTVLQSVRLYLVLGGQYQSLNRTDWEKFYAARD